MNENKTSSMFTGWLLGIIQAFDRNDLIEMIRADAYPQVFDFQLPRYLWGIQSLIAEKRDLLLHEITVENTIEYSREYRPDLTAILEHPKGTRWMNNFLKMIRYIIKNIDKDWEYIRTSFFRSLQKVNNEDVNNLLESKEIVYQPEQDKIMSNNNTQKAPVSGNRITSDYF